MSTAKTKTVTKKIAGKKENVVKSKAVIIKKKTLDLTVSIVDLSGKKKGTMTLPKEIFGVSINEDLMTQAVRVYQINQRQGGAVVQTRGEVSGSRRKIWRQKGTGRARHGDQYASIFVGGGKAHGPRPRNFEASLSKKMRQRALCSALSSQYKQEHIIVVDGLDTLDAKTKTFVKALSTITGKIKQGKALEKMIVATPKKIESVYLAGRNVAQVTICDVHLLHTYDVLNNKMIIFSKDAIGPLVQMMAKS